MSDARAGLRGLVALAIVASCRDHAPAVAGDEADTGMATFATLGDSTSGGDAGFDPCAIAMYGSLEVVDLALAGDRLAVGFDWNSDGVSDLALSSISGGFAWFDGRDLTADRLPLSLASRFWSTNRCTAPDGIERSATSHGHWAVLGTQDLDGDAVDDIVVTMVRDDANAGPSARIAVFPGRLDGADAGG